MASHSSTLAWEIPWTEEPGALQSTGSQGVRHDLVTEHTRSHACPGDRWAVPSQVSTPFAQLFSLPGMLSHPQIHLSCTSILYKSARGYHSKIPQTGRCKQRKCISSGFWRLESVTKMSASSASGESSLSGLQTAAFSLSVRMGFALCVHPER